MNYKVVFSAACEKDLLELNAYIAGERSAAVADRFVDSIELEKERFAQTRKAVIELKH